MEKARCSAGASAVGAVKCSAEAVAGYVGVCNWCWCSWVSHASGTVGGMCAANAMG